MSSKFKQSEISTRCRKKITRSRSKISYRKNNRFVRLLTYEPREKLLYIGYELYVPNIEGFSKKDTASLDLTDEEGFKRYKLGWGKSTKMMIVNHIFNKLYDINQILIIGLSFQ